MHKHFDSIIQSHDVAIEQIKKAHLGKRPGYKVLDLGVGDGTFLEKLYKQIPNAHLTGLDIAKNKLIKVSQKLPITTIEGSATHASQFLPLNSQDLILAHFINAYIPLKTLFKEVDLLTHPNGHFSLVTTTYESFPTAQEKLARFIAEETLVSTVVGHYYKAMVRNATVASGWDELLQVFQQYQFTVIKHTRLSIPIVLKNIDELIQFAIEGTWFLNSVSMRMLPKNFLLERLKRLFSKIFLFPYHDTHVIDIVLARKFGNN